MIASFADTSGTIRLSPDILAHMTLEICQSAVDEKKSHQVSPIEWTNGRSFCTPPA
jgi:hypothetical protein